MAEETGTDLVEVQTTELQEAAKPVLLTDEAITIIKHNIDMAQKLVYEVLEEGVDYGRIPGTPAPGLWDPGAGKISAAFNVYPKYTLLHAEESDGLVSYTVESTLLSRGTGKPMSTGIGAASTRETKYKYRWHTAEEAREFGYSPEQLEGFKRNKDNKYRIPNPEYGELVNTIVKMASKRADVDAVQNLPAVSSALRKLFGQPVNERNKWRSFWGKVNQLGLTEEQVHTVLGVASVNDWLAQGKTIEQAIETLARRPVEPKAEPKAEVDIPFIEDKLLQGWKIAKDAIKRLSITGEQIQKWFAHYNIEIGLADFEKVVPPAGITNEILNRFVDSLVAYESSHKVQK